MKNLKIIPLLLLIALFLITGFSLVRAQSQSTKDNMLHIEEWIPCANDGVGEWMVGDISVRVTRHFDKDGNLMRINANPQGGILIGQITGTVFHAVGSTQFLWDINPTNGAFTDTYIDRWHFVGHGGINFNIFTTIHFTINNNDEFTADVNHYLEGCK